MEERNDVIGVDPAVEGTDKSVVYRPNLDGLKNMANAFTPKEPAKETWEERKAREKAERKRGKLVRVIHCAICRKVGGTMITFKNPWHNNIEYVCQRCAVARGLKK